MYNKEFFHELIQVLQFYNQLGVDIVVDEESKFNKKQKGNDMQNMILHDETATENIQNQDILLECNEISEPKTHEEWVKYSETLAKNAKTKSELFQAIQGYDGCDIKKSATNTVLFDGNENAKIMIVGEAPGAEEDKQGIPFCGRSGILLNKMLNAINLFREKDVYITNTVFWRPPGNRNPTTREKEMCKPFFEKHVSFINPSIIMLLGSTAVSAVLQSDKSISSTRGKFFSYTNRYIKKEIPVFVIYHPAYLLRQASQKQTTWEDLQLLQSFLQKEKIM